MNLFKKYTSNIYGVKFSRYGFQDYIPDWLDYYFKIYILRFWHILFGHRWGKWATFEYVPKNGTGWVSLEDKQTRRCSCYAEQSRPWSKKNQRRLNLMAKRFGKTLGSGYIGELYGVRFVKTKIVSSFKLKKNS